jgi:aminoglycoside phosphotransferase (APT) family kinase protein
MEDAIREAVGRMGLAGTGELVLEPLSGGVASDIYRVEAGGRTFAIKRALDRLRVAAEWRVPTDRNAHEVAWLRLAGRAGPGAAPAVLGHDAASGCFAMAYLDPGTHPVWKSELMAGRVDPAFSGAVGTRLAAIHAATAGDPSVAAAFDTIGIFHSIRLEPYLEATAARHPALASLLMTLSRETASRRIALAHGDVSPKNILVGAAGPVFLDAECAWYGDPAFDLAFCLNHLLLKRIAVPSAAAALSSAFEALAARYLDGVTWEDARDLEARAAALLPALLLARVDGKSPVEYVTEDADKARVRRAAMASLTDPPGRLSDVLARTVEGFGERAAAR